MAVLFRKIDYKRLWDSEPSANEAWLTAGEVRADALRDLRTDGNALSFYFVEEPTQDVIERLAGALAANRNILDKIDYLLFEADLLRDLQIDLEAKLGTTPDEEVNKWHRDLVHLTADKLAKLGKVMQGCGRLERILHKRVGRIINHGIAIGNIDAGKIPPELTTKLAYPQFAAAPRA